MVYPDLRGGLYLACQDSPYYQELAPACYVIVCGPDLKG